MEIYALVASIYYDLPVDYTTQLLDEFVKSIGNTNVVHGISCARYWSLILQFANENEGILVPKGEPTTEFHYIIFPRQLKIIKRRFPLLQEFLMGCFERLIP